jgi:hypothetical protein
LNFSMYKVISALLTDKYDYARSIINSFKDSTIPSYSKKMLQVYEQLIKLFLGQQTEVLSEDENEKEYTSIIFEICEILLMNKRFDEFEISLNLLNLISDKSVLLILGKLYFKHGYIEMAKKEIIRSIKEFEVYDTEGLGILCK